MSEPAPFKAGQWVRMKPEHRRNHRNMKSFTGVVVSCGRYHPNGRWHVRLKRDGLSSVSQHWAQLWEPVPTGDLTLDQTAQALADAVKVGDPHAALLLADRVMELVGGTPRERAG